MFVPGLYCKVGSRLVILSVFVVAADRKMIPIAAQIADVRRRRRSVKRSGELAGRKRRMRYAS